MSEDTKEQIQAVLELLRNTCIKNGVSLAVHFENNELIFFNTARYLDNHTFSGFTVKMQDLVR